MSHNYRDTRQNIAPAQCEPVTLVDKNSKFYHPIRFLQQYYGMDVAKLLTTINGVFALGLITKYIKNKKLRFTLNAIRYGIPTVLYGSQLYVQFKSYIKEISDEKSPVYRARLVKLSKVLEIKESDPAYTNFYQIETSIGSEIILWMLSRPNTRELKLIKFFDIDNMRDITKLNLSSDIDINIAILFEYKLQKIALEFTLQTNNNVVACSHQMSYNTIHHLSDDKVTELNSMFLYEFISSLNTKKNILSFNYNSILCEPRIKVEETINQFDVPELIKELQQVLDCGRKRAYAFVSRPGTGKSTILRKIEEVMTDYVFFKLGPADFDNSSIIKSRFAIAKKVPKSVLIIEDLDACGLHEKNSKAGVFLDEIDDVNNVLNMIILVTINDTSRVHFSIIDRPGRFDKVIEIKPPQTIIQVYQIMTSKAAKLKKKYCEGSNFSIPEMESIDRNLLEDCLAQEFTQAEITNAITEQIFIDIAIKLKEWNDISVQQFNELFTKAIESHKLTKLAIKHCNFNNGDPSHHELQEVVPNKSSMINEPRTGYGR